MLYLLMVILSLLWGLSFLGTQILLDVMAPMEILAVRWLLAFVTFSLLVAFQVIKVDYKGKPVKWLVGAAAIQPCLYAILETWGVKLTTSSESSIFIAMVPLMVVVEGAVFLRQKVRPKVIGAIALSFTGVLICITFSPGFSTGSKFLGYLILLGAVVSGAAYALYVERLKGIFSPMEITYALTIGGSLFFNILSLGEGNGLRPYSALFSSPETAAALLFLGVGCSCVAYMIFNYSLSRLQAAIASTIQTNSITVVGVLAGIILGGEPWGWYTAVGLTLTITGICISSLDKEKG